MQTDWTETKAGDINELGKSKGKAKRIYTEGVSTK